MNDKEQGATYHRPPSIKAVYCARCGAGPYAWNELRDACRECGCGDFIEKEIKPSQAEERLIYSRREIEVITDAAEQRGFEAGRKFISVREPVRGWLSPEIVWEYETFDEYKKAKP